MEINQVELKKFKTTLSDWLNRKLGKDEFKLEDTQGGMNLLLGDIIAPDIGSNESKKFESFKDEMSNFFWDIKQKMTYKTIVPNWWGTSDDSKLLITVDQESNEAGEPVMSSSEDVAEELRQKIFDYWYDEGTMDGSFMDSLAENLHDAPLSELQKTWQTLQDKKKAASTVEAKTKKSKSSAPKGEMQLEELKPAKYPTLAKILKDGTIQITPTPTITRILAANKLDEVMDYMVNFYDQDEDPAGTLLEMGVSDPEQLSKIYALHSQYTLEMVKDGIIPAEGKLKEGLKEVL